VLDFFAGSGTTGHAVINLNREDGGTRKFIMVEMANYFDSVLLPRLKKIIFAPEWKDGKPKRAATSDEAERSPGIIKVMRLESYEDTLNNLQVSLTASQKTVFDAINTQGADTFKEQYILRYMLDVETRGSSSLLNVQAFRNPAAYKLKVKQPGSDDSREVNVDLVETFISLLGFRVSHISAPQSFAAQFEWNTGRRLRLKDRLKEDSAGPWWFRTVAGTMPDGQQTLIIWRNLTGESEQDNLVLNEWFETLPHSTNDFKFRLIYVNGDNNLENVRGPDQTWKVRLIEDDFYRLMFDSKGI
jgi:adenine-specific DNA-methyltransferase